MIQVSLFLLFLTVYFSYKRFSYFSEFRRRKGIARNRRRDSSTCAIERCKLVCHWSLRGKLTLLTFIEHLPSCIFTEFETKNRHRRNGVESLPQSSLGSTVGEEETSHCHHFVIAIREVRSWQRKSSDSSRWKVRPLENWWETVQARGRRAWKHWCL